MWRVACPTTSPARSAGGTGTGRCHLLEPLLDWADGLSCSCSCWEAGTATLHMPLGSQQAGRYTELPAPAVLLALQVAVVLTEKDVIRAHARDELGIGALRRCAAAVTAAAGPQHCVMLRCCPCAGAPLVLVASGDHAAAVATQDWLHLPLFPARLCRAQVDEPASLVAASCFTCFS